MIEGGCYRRSISVNENRGYLEVSLDASRNALNVCVQIGEPRSLFFIIERIRAMFDLDADWATIAQTLGADPGLASLIRSDPGLRAPGCWNGFEFATRAIVGQQMGIRGANALEGRMVRAFGQPFCDVNGLTHLFPTPEVLADADLESVGLPRVEADVIRALARAVRAGQISFEKVLDSDAFLRRLCQVPGIGGWTAQWVAVRALREPDAFPSADLHLAETLHLGSSTELEKYSLAWRPWRAYAAIYLWTFAGEFRKRENGREAPARKKEVGGKSGFHRRIPAGFGRVS
jgi:AraC family transcriptional regulator of adaptative response / DNA-3-methyladenine glycosylase II